MFTNNLGQVLFVDQAFLNLMQYPEAGVVTGEPLFKALRIDSQSGKSILEAVRQGGTVHNRLIEIANPIGGPLYLSVKAEASHDTQGNFIGADITLRRHTEAAIKIPETLTVPAELPTTAGTISHREVVDEVSFADNHQFLELYFTTHIKAAYVLYQRMIGLMARNHLDKIINQTSQKNGWAIQIRSGLFTTPLSRTTPEMYRVLLREIFAYGVNMVGQSMVAREVDKVHQQMHEGVRGLAQDAGLYQLYR
jgi:hypothetical protein